MTAALFLNGTVGSGKSATADAVGDLLAERGIPHAVIDLDALRRVWPAPADDPFQTELELANLSDYARNASAAGARVLVLAGVVEEVAALPRYEEAVGGPVTLVRLRADPGVTERRLRARHSADPDGLDWHLARRGELEAVLDGAGLPDTTVTTDDRTPRQVAEEALSGWDAV
ncbi:hypothetical protein [Leifsonia sp. NPDC080035]|uniref:Uncharacterized protein n=1 Tax=Leifsonia sp. NPDC080035 TaxID=3143936 RepID=A0AAU7GGI3_9MICO